LNGVGAFRPHPLRLCWLSRGHVEAFLLYPLAVPPGVRNVGERLGRFDLHETRPFMGMNRLSHSRWDCNLQHANAVIFEDYGLAGAATTASIERCWAVPTTGCNIEAPKTNALRMGFRIPHPESVRVNGVPISWRLLPTSRHLVRNTTLTRLTCSLCHDMVDGCALKR
jgi:hypothetical protein